MHDTEFQRSEFDPTYFVEFKSRIEPLPAEELMEIWFSGKPSASWEEEEFWRDYYEDNEEVEEARREIEDYVGGPLGYVPFDIEKELKEFAHLRKASYSKAPHDREELKNRIADIQAAHTEQIKGLAACIEEVHMVIGENPDATREYLLQIFRAKAPQYGFTLKQLHNIATSLDNYIEKHERVKKYRKLYPDNAALYEVCFGRKPRGEVRVIQLPMTLHFAMALKEDYAWAYTYNTRSEISPELTEGEKERALKSSGCALYYVREPELKSVVTLEQASIDERVYLPEEHTDRNDATLYIYEQYGDITIEIPHTHLWRIMFLERDEFNNPRRIQVYDSEESGAQPRVDYRIVRSSTSNLLYEFENVKTGTLHGNEIIPLYANGQYFGRIEIWENNIRIEGNGNGDIVVKYTISHPELVESGRVALDPRVLTHEEQHLFNRLFTPIEAQTYLKDVITKAILKSDDLHEIEIALSRDIAKYYRMNLGIDSRARDEIIATYREGADFEEILRRMLYSENYDYKKDYIPDIAALPKRMVEFIARYASVASYRVFENDEGDGYVDPVGAQPFQLDPEIAVTYVEEAFGERYQEDLKKWVGALEIMQKKGYTREEVIAIVYQHPVGSWQACARRLVPKHKLAQEPHNNTTIIPTNQING